MLPLVLLNSFLPVQPAEASSPKIEAPQDLTIIQNRTLVEKAVWHGWKKHYSISLLKGTIVFDPFSQKVFSEASGHALILAAQFGDQEYFDQVVNGLDHYFINAQGLYFWEITSTGEPFKNAPTKVGSASETELNVVMALLQAAELVKSGVWPKTLDYQGLADQLEAKIWEYEVINFQNRTLFLPSDDKTNQYWPIIKQGSQIIKIAWAPTYFNPAYFKVLAAQYPRHDWAKLIDDGYALSLAVLRDSQTLLENDLGLKGTIPVPAWVWLKKDKVSDDLVIGNYFKGAFLESDKFSNEFDAIRIPQYLGLDYLWNSDQRSRKFLVEFLDLAGVKKPEDAYCGAMPGYPKGWNSAEAIGQFGIANKIVGDGQDFKDHLEIYLKPEYGYIGVDPKYYYNNTLTLYAYLILNDRFVKIIK